MARPRKRENQGLPQNLVCRERRNKKGVVTRYYFYSLGNGKEKSLGKDKLFAVLEAAKLNIVSPQKLVRALFIEVAKRYELEVMPLKAKNTITSNKRAIKRLVQFFGDPPIALEDIEPKHIRMYLEWRKDKTASANIEVSLFNHIWNTAREWGYTNQISPTTGIKKYQVKFRDIYVEDYILDKLYQCADQDMKDIIDISYLLGQRPIDIVNIHSNHIYDGILHITQQKTGKKIRIEVTGKLAEILNRRITTDNQWLFLNNHGKKLARQTLTDKFRLLRELTIQTYPELSDEISKVQIRDLRAKTATDLSLFADTETARKQLGHTSSTMTQHYIRKDSVLKPLERERLGVK